MIFSLLTFQVVLRVDLIDEIVQVTEEQSYKIGRRLATEEGILSGISTGAAVYAALQIGRRSQYRGQLIVAIQPSGGERYLSTAMFQNPESIAIEQSLTFISHPTNSSASRLQFS